MRSVRRRSKGASGGPSAWEGGFGRGVRPGGSCEPGTDPGGVPSAGVTGAKRFTGKVAPAPVTGQGSPHSEAHTSSTAATTASPPRVSSTCSEQIDRQAAKAHRRQTLKRAADSRANNRRGEITSAVY